MSSADSPRERKENYVYEYEFRDTFRFVRRHTLGGGYTSKGIQTAAFADGRWWFGCYGDPKILLTAAADFSDVRRFEQDASLGLRAARQRQLSRGPRHE